MPVDWRRAEWQYWANRYATWALCVLVLFQAPEIYEAFKYHFPWWDVMFEAITTPLTYVAWFVKRHTDMYRWDI